MSLTTIVTVTANTTLSSNYNTYIVDATTSNITLTLPTIISNGTNFLIYRDDSSSNTVTINSSGSNTIKTNSGLTITSVTISTQSVTNIQSYNNSWYFMIPTGNRGLTGSTVPFPPNPNPDYYLGLTNQQIPINVVSGVSGNTGGVDTLGGSLTNPTNAIISVTIVTPPSFGTLTSTTGTTGSYIYQSNPRFTGLDEFMYTITDSTGINSKNNTTCYINIPSLPPSGTGPSFTFCTASSIYTCTNGVTGFLYTPTFPGSTGLTATSMNALAVNRDDNLLYYVLNNTSISNGGKIWAYDYVNNSEFLLVDANNSSLFGATGINFGFQSLTSGTYSNYNYFITLPNTPSYYIINVAPYSPSSGNQAINNVTNVSLSNGLNLQTVGMMMNPNTDRLITTGLTGATGIMNTFIPYTGSIIKSTSFTGGTGYILTPGVCSEICAIANGTTNLSYINPSNATITATSFSFPPTGFTSATGYISPVPN